MPVRAGDTVSMFGIETLSGNAQAAALIGLVLIEAVVLHVGYSGLTRIAAPHVRRLLTA
jgi:hypothetical protein